MTDTDRRALYYATGHVCWSLRADHPLSSRPGANRRNCEGDKRVQSPSRRATAQGKRPPACGCVTRSAAAALSVQVPRARSPVSPGRCIRLSRHRQHKARGGFDTDLAVESDRYLALLGLALSSEFKVELGRAKPRAVARDAGAGEDLDW